MASRWHLDGIQIPSKLHLDTIQIRASRCYLDGMYMPRSFLHLDATQMKTISSRCHLDGIQMKCHVCPIQMKNGPSSRCHVCPIQMQGACLPHLDGADMASRWVGQPPMRAFENPTIESRFTTSTLRLQAQIDCTS